MDTGERAGRPSKAAWLVILWILVASWCVISLELRYRASIQNAIDPDEIDWEATPLCTDEGSACDV